MTKLKCLMIVTTAIALFAGPVCADTIKVGVIGPFSGPFGLFGKNFKAGIEAYQAKNGKSAKGHEVEFLYRDLDAIDPAKRRRSRKNLSSRTRCNISPALTSRRMRWRSRPWSIKARRPSS